MHRAGELDDEAVRRHKKQWHHELSEIYTDSGCLEGLVHQSFKDCQLDGHKEYFSVPLDGASALLAKAVERAVPEYLEGARQGEKRAREYLDDEEDAKRRRLAVDARAYEERADIETRLRERQATIDAEKHQRQATIDAEKHECLAKIQVDKERGLAEAAVEKVKLENALLGDDLRRASRQVLLVEAPDSSECLEAYLTRRHTLLASTTPNVYRIRLESPEAAAAAQRRIHQFLRAHRGVFAPGLMPTIRHEG